MLLDILPLATFLCHVQSLLDGVRQTQRAVFQHKVVHPQLQNGQRGGFRDRAGYQNDRHIGAVLPQGVHGFGKRHAGDFVVHERDVPRILQCQGQFLFRGNALTIQRPALLIQQPLQQGEVCRIILDV